jgi:hypothetical protein
MCKNSVIGKMRLCTVKIRDENLISRGGGRERERKEKREGI